MKKLLFFAFLLISITLSAQVPKFKVDSLGNYVAISNAKFKATETKSGKTYTNSKGNVFPVYLTSTGRLVYYRTAKSGNVYKVYLDKGKP